MYFMVSFLLIRVVQKVRMKFMDLFCVKGWAVMCGRFTLTVELDVLFERFQNAYELGFLMPPSFNIAPTHKVLAVIRGERGNKLGPLQWGLVPSWAKDASVGAKMINARSETLHEKASFKSLIHRQRCLVVADSFYEWKRDGDKKQPYRIQLKDGEPFAFAGLWSIWGAGPQKLATCTIITTASNDLMAPLHERMPVILRPDEEEKWLNPSFSFSDVKPLLKAYSDDEMRLYPVSSRLNSPKENEPGLIKAI
jgi:putative SOS response-associated peptidase YedK